MTLEKALGRAEDVGPDVIEVAATADPPVCRIADLGRFRFEQDKRSRDARKNQHVSEVKEVRFRGREVSHPEVATARIDSIAAGVTDIGIVEHQPSVEGRTMFAILARGRAQT